MKIDLPTASAEIIYAKVNIKIMVGPAATPETVKLLKRTVYGTHGPRYQHTGQEKKINHIQHPYFFSFTKG